MANDFAFDDAQASNISQGLHGSMTKNDSFADGRTSIKKQLAQMLAKGSDLDGDDEI